MPLLTGTRLGSYEIESLLGAGGMGEVYRARDLQLGRYVAVKVISNLSTDAERMRRFEREARAAAALSHPNILAIFQLGIHEGAPYLVSELLEGETLRRLVKRGRLSTRKLVDYGVQIANGLAAAHEKGIVHRDLKPENLFITHDGRVKILDFGLAKLSPRLPISECGPSTLAVATESGTVLGTVGYMSPEQVRGESSDYRTDIFSFGAVLYEMITGTRAFQGATPADTMTMILKDDPPNISDIVSNVAPGLERIVHRCLEKKTEMRFHSASDLAFTLEPLSERSTSGEHHRAGEVPPAGTRWGLLAAILLFAVATLLSWHWRTKLMPIIGHQTVPETTKTEKSSHPISPHEIWVTKVRSYDWFDPITGNPRVWYLAVQDSNYRLFDAPGLDPLSGAELRAVTPEIVERLKRIEGSKGSESANRQPTKVERKREKGNENAVVKDNLTYPDSMIRDAQNASDSADYQKAIDVCMKVLNMSSGNPACIAIKQHASIKLAELFVQQGATQFEKGKFDEALRYAARAIDLDPANQSAEQLKKLALQMKSQSRP